MWAVLLLASGAHNAHELVTWALDLAQAGSRCHPSSGHGWEGATEDKKVSDTKESGLASPALGLEDFHLLWLIGKGS